MTQLAQQELDFADVASWTFDFEGLVTGTPSEVWDVFTDNESWTTWFKNCRECRSTSDPAGGVGSTRFIRVGGLQVNERFIAWEPAELWAFTAMDMPMSFATAMVERARFTATDDRHTRIDYRMAVEPRGWAKPLRRIIASQAAKSFAASFARLDQHLATLRRDSPGSDAP